MMKELTNIDFIYPISGIIVGIILIGSPRAFMRKVKISEESIKAESLLKKAGSLLILICAIFAAYIYYKVNYA